MEKTPTYKLPIIEEPKLDSIDPITRLEAGYFINRFKETCRTLKNNPLFAEVSIFLKFPQSKMWLMLPQGELQTEHIQKLSENPELFEKIPVHIHNQQIGVIYITGHSPAILQILQLLIDNNTFIAEYKAEQEILSKELHFAWEMVDVIHQFILSKEATQDEKKALQLILNKVKLLQTEFIVNLWFEQQGKLVSVDQTCSEEVSWKQGALGLLYEKNNALVFTKQKIKQMPDLEHFLRNASGIVLIPLKRNNSIVGAFCIWTEDPSFKFDSRILFPLSSLATITEILFNNIAVQKELLKKERMDQEMEIGCNIQQTLLLGKVPQNNQLDIEALTVPSQNISGDFYDFFSHSLKCVDILIGDVMGKGIPAALVAAAIKSSFFRFTSEPSENNCDAASLEYAIESLNREITPELIQLETFATLCYARINTFVKQLSFIDCGHTSIIHYQDNIEDVEALNCCENLPLGIFPETNFKAKTLEFSPGDIFLFYSDGISEAKNHQGELFGEQRIIEVLQRFKRKTARSIVQELKKSVVEFSGQKHFADDLTCIIIKIKEVESQTVAYRIQLIRSRLDEVVQIRNFIENACGAIPYFVKNPTQLANLILAANEAATNIVRHAYKENPNGAIRCELSILPSKVKVYLIDRGTPFKMPGKQEIVDVTEIPEDELMTMEGGFGLYMIHNLVDRVSYRNTEKGNYLCLEKFFGG